MSAIEIAPQDLSISQLRAEAARTADAKQARWLPSPSKDGHCHGAGWSFVPSPRGWGVAIGSRTPSSNHDDILDHCCFAWSTLTDMPWKIMSIGVREWPIGHAQQDLVLPRLLTNATEHKT
jgi:hypothetical protein